MMKTIYRYEKQALGREYNLPILGVLQAYSDLKDVFGEGNIVLIGGRAVNIICRYETRKSNDVDFLVNGNLSEDAIRKLEKLGWKPSKSAYGNDRGHFERAFSYTGNKQVVIKIDINTVNGEDSLRNLMFKEEIMNDARTRNLLSGGDEFLNGKIKVASPSTLIAMKLKVIKESEIEPGKIVPTEIKKHKEDIYSLIKAEYNNSVDSLIGSKDLEIIVKMLSKLMPSEEVIRALSEAYNSGKRHFDEYKQASEIKNTIIEAIKEKAKMDADQSGKTVSTADWLASLVDSGFNKDPLSRYVRKEKDASSKYPAELIEKFRQIYSFYLDNIGTSPTDSVAIGFLAKEASNWSGLPKKEIEHELKEIFGIASKMEMLHREA